jgi:hypothetical protein
LLLNSTTGIGHGFYFYVQPYGSVTNGVTVTPAAPDTTDLSTAPPGRMTRFQWDGTKSIWRSDYAAPPIGPAFAGRRQTVAYGPMDTAGLPTFLPNTAGTLNLTSQNVTGTAALIASAANGWNQTNGQPLDVVGVATANITWAGLTASRAAATPNFLYCTIAGGVLTPQQTLLPPIYQWAGTPSTVAGQMTFNRAEMKAYLGNGATAPQTNLVVFGEAATDAVSVIATVMYAYNGRYESGYTATLPAGGTVTTKTHNLGIKPARKKIVAVCTTPDKGYNPGDEIDTLSGLCTATSIVATIPIWSDRNTASVMPATGNGNDWYGVNADVGILGPLIRTSWKYQWALDRGW